MSNCRPGDLAVVVKEFGVPMYGGYVLRVVRWHHTTGGWICEPQLRDEHGVLIAWCDDHLRPIRDPGDDAVDEMLQRVGKPESAAIEWALGTERTA